MIFSTWEALEEHVADDESLRRKLLYIRGGCACHISPPCSACYNPITSDEAEYLKLSVSLPQPDYMKATHDLCR